MGKFSNHQVYVNQFGEEVPSVTTILKMLNKQALIGWANYLGFKHQKVKDVLDEAAEVGTIIHAYMEAILRKENYSKDEMWKHIGKYGNKVYNRLLMINDWFQMEQPEFEPIFIEEKLVTTDYGGTVDYFGMYNGKKTILDFKTSKATRSNMFLQLSGYMDMIEESGEHIVEQAGIVIIREDHPVSVTLIDREALLEFREAFRELKDFHNKWYELSQKDYWKWGNIYD